MFFFYCSWSFVGVIAKLPSPCFTLILHPYFDKIKSLSPIYQTRLGRQVHRIEINDLSLKRT